MKHLSYINVAQITKSVLVFSFLIFLLIPKIVSAHSAGFPPFFKVNGTIADSSPLVSLGVLSLNIQTPQDLGPENYLINQPIDLEIDKSLLGNAITDDILTHTKFSWDFGDGTKGEGLKNSHAYTKTGSYILSIIADFGDPNTPPQLIESVQLNILPNKDYQIPQAVIKVNGKKITGLSKETLEFDLNNKLTFDGSESRVSSKNIEYLWDFGDGKTSNQVKVDHRYKLPQYFTSPILHIKDENGLVSDTFINIKNSGKNYPNDPETEDRNKNLIFGGTGVALIIILGLVFKIHSKKTLN